MFSGAICWRTDPRSCVLVSHWWLVVYCVFVKSEISITWVQLGHGKICTRLTRRASRYNFSAFLGRSTSVYIISQKTLFSFQLRFNSLVSVRNIRCNVSLCRHYSCTLEDVDAPFPKLLRLLTLRNNTQHKNASFVSLPQDIVRKHHQLSLEKWIDIEIHIQSFYTSSLRAH